jgi:hypothetical protein
LYDQITRHEIKPRQSYNIDEKGFLLGRIRKSKRIFSRASWEQEGIKTNMQDGSREWITTVACICSNGTTIPLVLIFASKNSTLQLT